MNRVYEKLYEKYKKGSLDEDQLLEALEIFKNYDESRNEMKEYSKLYLYMGISLMLSSLFYFIAFNWRGINNYGKFSIVISLMIISLIIYLLKIKEIYRKLALFSLSFITGILFALFGQVYQTGADTYVLFLTWSIAILPMVLISRYFLMYILLFITSTLATSMFIWELGGIYAFVLVSNIIIILALYLLDKQKKSFRGKEVFRVVLGGIFIIYHLLSDVYYSINGPFLIGIISYGVFLFYIFKNKKLYKKGFRLFSLVPLFILSPTTIVWLTIKLEFFKASSWISVIISILLLIIASYVTLSRIILKVKREGEDE